MALPDPEAQPSAPLAERPARRVRPRRLRRGRILRIRLSEAEAATLRERAERTRPHTLAGWARATLLGQPMPPAARPVPQVNLNQIARHLNLGNVLTDRDLLPMLRQLSQGLQEVRRALLGITE